MVLAFQCAIERPDLVKVECIDTAQQTQLAEEYHVGSIPHTSVNNAHTMIGLYPEERFVQELIALDVAEEPQNEAETSMHVPGEAERFGQVDVVVAGGGPAGLTAAIYLSRSGLSCVVLEKETLGGQVSVTPVVENYPGFAAVPGKQLMETTVAQARQYVEILEGEGADEIKVGKHVEVYTPKHAFLAKALVLATGAKWKKVGAIGEDRYFGFGVSYCSTCDGYMYKGKKAAVVGGGNTALTDALHLKNLGVSVTVIHRQAAFRAQQYLQDSLARENIPVLYDTVVEEVTGEDGRVTALKLKNTKDGALSELSVDCLFVAVGLQPNTELASDLGITLTSEGYIQVDRSMRTNIPRIYAAGDVTGGVQQIVTAVGEGSTAALSVFEDIAHPYWK